LALGAVDLVQAIALPHWPALTSAWQVETLRKYVARIALVAPTPIARAATANEVPFAAVTVATAVVVSRIVSVQHGPPADF
jgi:predicted permease